jgi:hypothetical protein
MVTDETEESGRRQSKRFIETHKPRSDDGKNFFDENLAVISEAGLSILSD